MWQIDIYENLQEAREAEIFSIIRNRIETFESHYSRFRDESIVTKISKVKVGDSTGDRTFVLPSDAEKMFNIYKYLYILTNGLFTPLIGGVLSDFGYDSKYSLQAKSEIEKAPTWDEVMEYNYPKLLIKKPALLDFGAAGKGYIIDIIGELFEENNINEYCIDAGGDIRHRNNNVIRVGLENPEDTNQVIGVCELGNESICGSAGNRRAWGTVNHIMNPKTLESSSEIIAVWVTAKNTMLADALTTCLFFVPASILTLHYQFEYILLRKDFSIEKSANFSGEFFS